MTTCADTLDDAARYGAVKRRLAALHANGDDYTRANTELIQELTGKAGPSAAPAGAIVGGVSGVRGLSGVSEVSGADAKDHDLR